MTNDEIKMALRHRCKIRHNDPRDDNAIIYDYAQAWRVAYDRYGNPVSSLELVKGNAVVVARAEECEVTA